MGRVYKAKYTKADDKGSRVTVEAPGWYIEFTDAAGSTRRRKGGTTEAQAKDALRKAESNVLSEKNGLPTIKAAEITCADLLERYLSVLRSHVTELHAESVKRRIEDVLFRTRAATLKQLTSESVESALAALATEKLAARTINTYLQAVKGMLAWAVKSRLLPYNPLDCITPRSEEIKARVRRSLSEDEIARLLSAALDGPRRRAQRCYMNRPRKDKTFKQVSIPLARQAKLAREGRKSVMVYRLMIEAGLRLNEVRCLLWRDLDLDAKVANLRAETTKNGKAESVPLSPGLLEALKAWRKDSDAADADVVVTISSRTLKCFDDDLVAAGIATRDAKGRVLKKDASGRTLDLHALRHTCGTRLVGSGADIKSVQAIMRHSTPSLTLGIYVHKDTSRMAAAVAGLPELKPSFPSAAKAEGAPGLKTGTDNEDVNIDSPSALKVLPLSNRQGKSGEVCNALPNHVLQNNATALPKPKVVGSNPIARLDLQERSFSLCQIRAYDLALNADPIG